ncbi:MAG: nucleotidyltransferase family protein [Bacteroidales bacterium]|nr:nucleotidyltransferase family protein [Bacteroidales bacterium]
MLFFELLQITLGNRESLSAVPSAKEWADIYKESQRQAITGILLHGIDKLPLEQRPPQTLLLQWIGVGQIIEQRNKLMDLRCGELLEKLTEQEVRGSILKGQGIAQLYDNELRQLRQNGDIDVYVDCGLEKSLAFAKAIGQQDIDWDYKHLHLNVWEDTEVEMHYRVEVLLNLRKNRKLQKWFYEHQEAIRGSRFKFQGGEIATPTVEFNVFYILLHIYRHFLYEGVGLRQIVDYYMVLCKVHNSQLMAQEYVEAVREFGMEKFAKGLMWVMKEALGMPDKWMLWEPDHKECEYILKQVMNGGNFGHHDKRLNHGNGKLSSVKNILTHNIHLLTHYPSDTLWVPVWIVWHKLWKIRTGLTLNN